MKIEFTYLERGYLANLYRARAMRVRELAGQKSAGGNGAKADLESEATWCAQRAQALDDSAEVGGVSDKEPARVDGERDLK